MHQNQTYHTESKVSDVVIHRLGRQDEMPPKETKEKPRSEEHSVLAAESSFPELLMMQVVDPQVSKVLGEEIISERRE